MATNHQPTSAEAVSVLKDVEQAFPHKTLGDDKWYLVAVSAKYS